MRARILTAALVAVLVAAAFFLPERLLIWGDRQLLDRLQMESQNEEREGFAESIRLTVPEKILLLRSGRMTVLELDRTAPSVLYALEEPDAPEELGESAQLWEDRLSSVRGEIITLQTMGGLPEVWLAGSQPDCAGKGDLLYLDQDAHMSFQVYQLSLNWGDYSLDLLVDQQSERILSFALRWTQGAQPAWGSRGASGFGGAWRDYWKMDSVSTGWYNEYTRGILENVESQVSVNGDYAAYDQITFLYDGQTLPVPLDCQGAWARNFSILWNR